MNSHPAATSLHSADDSLRHKHRSSRPSVIEALEARIAPAAISVAVISSGTDAGGFDKIVAQLNDDTAFDFTATRVLPSDADTLEELAAYDVVVIGDGGNSNSGVRSIASVLKTWHENGGGVVAVGWSVFAADYPSYLADLDAIIPVVTAPSWNYSQSGGVVVVNTSHPVTSGLSAVDTGSYEIESPTSGAVDAGAVVLGTTGGAPTIVAGGLGSGRSVYLGPIYSGHTGYYGSQEILRTGTADLLLEQAVAWAAGASTVPPVDTTAVVDGLGNLVITDANGGTSNDSFTLSLVSVDGQDYIRLHDGTTNYDTLVSAVTGTITIDTAGGNDTVTLDLTGGDFIPAGGLFYNGGEAGDDALAIMGGAQGAVTYGYMSPNDGTVLMENFGLVTYTGLEPISNSGTATDVVFNLTSGLDQAVLEDATGAGTLQLRSANGSFELTTFTNPSGSVTINTGGGADTLSVSTISDLTSALTLGSAANPFTSITFTGAVTLAADNSLSADASGTIAFANGSADLTTSGTGSITLTTLRNFTFANGSSITTTSGGITLAANAAGTTAGAFTGIAFDGATLASTSGDIAVTGKGGTGGGRGIDYSTSVATSISTAGSGTIDVVATGVDADGIFMEIAAHVIQTENGDLSITGTNNSVGATDEGISFYAGTNNMKVRSTGSGDITLRASTVGAEIDLLLSGVQVSTGEGGNVTLLTDRLEIFTGGVSGSVTTPGTTTITSLTDALPISLGAEVASALSLTVAELDTISAGTIQIGNTNSGAVTVNAVLMKPTTVFNIATLEATTVRSGASLNLVGSVTGPLTVNSGGDIAPGTAFGIINSGSVSFASGSTFTVVVDGTAAGVDHDQLNVTGTVALGGAALAVSGAITASPNQEVVLINNDGAEPVTGTFAGLAQGALVTVNGSNYRINYAGGDGNDVTLFRATANINGTDRSDTIRITRDVADSSLVNITVKNSGGTQAFTVDVDLITGFFVNGSGDTDTIIVQGPDAIDFGAGFVDLASEYIQVQSSITATDFTSRGQNFMMSAGRTLATTAGDIVLQHTGNVRAAGSFLVAADEGAGLGDVTVTAGAGNQYVSLGSVTTDGGELRTSSGRSLTATGAIDTGAGAIDLRHGGNVTLRGEVTGASFLSQGRNFTLSAGRTLATTAGDIVFEHAGNVRAAGSFFAAADEGAGLGDVRVTAGTGNQYVNLGSVTTDGGELRTSSGQNFMATGAIDTGAGLVSLDHGNFVALRGDVTAASLRSEGRDFTLSAGRTLATTAGDIVLQHTGNVRAAGSFLVAADEGAALGAVNITAGTGNQYVLLGSVTTDGGAFTSSAGTNFGASGDIATGEGAIAIEHGGAVVLGGDTTGGAFSTRGASFETGSGDDITVAGVMAFNHSGVMVVRGALDAASYTVNGNGAMRFASGSDLSFRVDVAVPPVAALLAKNGGGSITFEAGSQVTVAAMNSGTPLVGGPYPLLSASGGVVDAGFAVRRTGPAAGNIGDVKTNAPQGATGVEFFIIAGMSI